MEISKKQTSSTAISSLTRRLAISVSYLTLMFAGLFYHQESQAVTFKKVNGTIASDKLSFTVNLEVHDFSNQVTSNFKDYLYIYIPKTGSSKPISTARGGSDSENYSLDFYWDPSQATVNEFTESNKKYLRFSNIVIRKTNTSDNTSTVAGLIESNTIKIKLGFSDSADTIAEQSSQEFPIEIVSEVIAEAPSITTAGASNQSVTVQWTPKSELVYSDQQSRTAGNILVLLLGSAASSSPDGINDIAMVANRTSIESDTAAAAGSCRFDPNAIGGQCIVCTDTENNYLSSDTEKLNALKGNGTNTFLADYRITSVVSGKSSFTGLENGVTYTAVLQYVRGNKRSNCLQASPKEDTTVLEFNGGGKAVADDPRCFIATAAFGSILDPYVENLRYLRDQYLLSNQLGRFFVSIYYAFSPDYAQSLEANPHYKPWVQAALLPFAGLASVLQVMNQFIPSEISPLILFLLLVSAGFYLFKIYESRFSKKIT